MTDLDAAPSDLGQTFDIDRDDLADLISPAFTCSPQSRLVDLIEPLTLERHHAAIVTDTSGHLLGIVTQTDLLASLGRPAVSRLQSRSSAAESL